MPKLGGIQMVTHVNAENFEKEVLQSSVPVLVDFFATWCGPCKIMSPVVEQLGEEIAPQGKVCKLDIDEAITIAQKYRVASVPTFMLFQNGQAVDSRVGTCTKDELLQMF